jgi:RNA polymerase sigma-70 factor (ECF subfamily)
MTITDLPPLDAPSDDRLTTLHLANSHDLLRYLNNLTHEPQTAEDLLQETMLRAWRSVASIPPDSEGGRRWLFTVARRLVIDTMRARRSRPRLADSVDLSLLTAADDTTATALAHHGVLHAFRSLSPAQREILTDLHLNGRTTEEVAERTRVPIGTVRSRAHYAMRALRATLDAD